MQEKDNQRFFDEHLFLLEEDEINEDAIIKEFLDIKLLENELVIRNARK